MSQYPGNYAPQGGYNQYPPQQGGYPAQNNYQQYPAPGQYPGVQTQYAGQQQQYGTQQVQGFQQQQYPRTNQPPAVPSAPYPPPPQQYGAPAPYPQQAPHAYPVAAQYAAPYAVAAPVAVAAPIAVPVAMAAPVAMGVPYAPMPYRSMRFCLQFKAKGLDRKDLFSKSDPFLAVLASNHPGGYITHKQVKDNRKETKHGRWRKFGDHSRNWHVVHRTETVKNCQHPTWSPFYVDLFHLCGGNMDSAFKIEVWDSDDHTNHDFIGSAVTTVRDLQVMREIRLVNKSRIGLFNTSGTVEVLQCNPA